MLKDIDEEQKMLISFMNKIDFFLLVSLVVRIRRGGSKLILMKSKKC